MKTTVETANYIFKFLNEKGYPQAQCILSSDKIDEIIFTNEALPLLKTLYDQSFRIQILSDGCCVETYLNSFEPEKIDEAVNSCLTMLEFSLPDESYRIPNKPNAKKFTSGPSFYDIDKLYDRMEEFVNDIHKEYPHILVEKLCGSFIKSNQLFINTNGVEYEYITGEYDFEYSFTSRFNHTFSSRNEYSFSTPDLNKKLIDCSIMNRFLLSDSEKQHNPNILSAPFVGKVIFTPACLPDIIMTLLDLSVSDTAIMDETSPWLDQLGKKVASDCLTLKTVPIDSRIVCGERFTEEGYLSENSTVIDHGRLLSYMLSDYAARKTGKQRAKNSSWNIEILPGNKHLKNILSEIDHGLLVNRFSGGIPSIDGNFSGIAKNSFFISNGEIKYAVKETMIGGNLFDLVNSIIEISSETVIDGTHICPWILFDHVSFSSTQPQ